MENATKALLIAAAVLVAILVISLGIIIYQRASETVTGAGDLSEYQIQQVNAKFTNYQGNVRGSDVNALLTTAFNHNLAQEEDALCVEVKYGTETLVEATTAQTVTPKKVEVGARYTVECSVDSTTKLIRNITVTKATSGSGSGS